MIGRHRNTITGARRGHLQVHITLAMAAVILLAGCAGPTYVSPSGTDQEVRTNPEQAFVEYNLDASEDNLGNIRGVVVDETVAPLEGVSITLLNQAATVVTKNSGAFAFTNLEAGVYFMLVEKAGFAPLQISGTVEAGAHNPPLLKVIVQRVPGTEPYILPNVHRGHIDCGAKVLSNSLDGCGVWSDYALGNTQEARVPIDNGTLLWVQNEIIWQPNSATAGELCTFVVGNPAQIGAKCGTPSWTFSYNESMIEDLRWYIPEAFQLRVMPGNLLLDTSGSLIVDQRFEVFTHAFYNFVPAEGWQFGFDGEHEVPT
jgi:hypothetical protein